MNVLPPGRALCALLIAGASFAVVAQRTVYRCGPDGTEYTSVPCPQGKPVDVDDARSVEQRRQARAAAQRERKAAEQMAAQRRQDEAAAAKKAAAADRPAARAASAPARAASKPQPDESRTKSAGDAVYRSPPVPPAGGTAPAPMQPLCVSR